MAYSAGSASYRRGDVPERNTGAVPGVRITATGVSRSVVVLSPIWRLKITNSMEPPPHKTTLWLYRVWAFRVPRLTVSEFCRGAPPVERC